MASSIVIASAGATFRFESKLLSRCKVDLTFLSIFSASSNNGVRSLVGSFRVGTAKPADFRRSPELDLNPC